MITRSTFLALLTSVGMGVATSASAQDDAEPLSYTPDHMWEVGFNGGFAFNSGDYDIEPGYAAGVHVRRALDHIFSARLDLQYFKTNSSSPNAPSAGGYTYADSDASSIGASFQAVMTLNNFRFNTPNRRFNIYAFAGPGVSRLNLSGTDENGVETDLIEDRDFDQIAFFADAGAGISFRISPKFNIGLEHKAVVPFGRSADFFDGYRNDQGVTSFRDIPNITNLRFNFNIGDAETKAEPLYWVNPLNQVIDELTELKARPVLDLTDSDDDGIIDMLDQDNETPEGARVDTRGIALDSDNDGVPDYEDGEPYSRPGVTVDASGVGVDPGYQTRPQVEELIANALGEYGRSEAANRMENWFLPMIHFGMDSYTVRKADYGNLKNVAEVLRGNPSLRVVIEGFADKTGGDDYNRVLSYNRAKSAKEYLQNRYGIDPSRLLIMFEGEDQVLVPTNAGSFMNRRVEFRVATGSDADMAEPQGPRAGRGTFFSGSRDAGY